MDSILYPKLYWITFIRNSGELKLGGGVVRLEFSPRPDFQKLSWHELSWIMYQMEVIIVKKLKLSNLEISNRPTDIEKFYGVVRFPKITKGNDLCNFQSKRSSISYDQAMKECRLGKLTIFSRVRTNDDKTDPKIKELMYLRYYSTYLPDRSKNTRLGESIFHKMEENIQPTRKLGLNVLKKIYN